MKNSSGMMILSAKVKQTERERLECNIREVTNLSKIRIFVDHCKISPMIIFQPHFLVPTSTPEKPHPTKISHSEAYSNTLKHKLHQKKHFTHMRNHAPQN